MKYTNDIISVVPVTMVENKVLNEVAVDVIKWEVQESIKGKK